MPCPREGVPGCRGSPALPAAGKAAEVSAGHCHRETDNSCSPDQGKEKSLGSELALSGWLCRETWGYVCVERPVLCNTVPVSRTVRYRRHRVANKPPARRLERRGTGQNLGAGEAGACPAAQEAPAADGAPSHGEAEGSLTHTRASRSGPHRPSFGQSVLSLIGQTSVFRNSLDVSKVAIYLVFLESPVLTTQYYRNC